MNKRLNRWMMLCLVLLAAEVGISQPPRGPLVISPQVNADHTIVFRYLAASAKEVKLSAQFEKAPLAMQKDSIGIWSVKVGPVAPDIYPYSFNVDGITVMDPANTYFFPNERFKASLVDVPGDTALLHAVRDVPHGSVDYISYPSAAGTTGNALIYTPPGYNQQKDQKYPVFYLVSGTTDTEETWFKVGKANFILDNLIAGKKAVPMIIVMPYGNIEARIAAQSNLPKPADPVNRESAEAIGRAKAFENDLLQNLLPWVEKNYRVKKDAASRAIGGFSRGGGQTLRTAFGNMDKFAWVCCYSAYLSPSEMQRDYPAICDKPDRTNQQLKLLWVSVGRDDFLYKSTVEFMEFLGQKKVHFRQLITDGGHTWMNTRNYLAQTAVLLFR